MKPGRNDACPCGSGLKHKKCCGQASHGTTARERSQTATPIMVNAAEKSKTPGEPRPCGECAACCNGWLKTHVLGNDLDVGQPCPYSSGQHCTVHERRPTDPCRIFFCGWAEAGSHLPEWMQPNKSGVIMLTHRSRWQGRPVDVVVSAGRDPEGEVLRWLQDYSIKHMRPLLFQQKDLWYGFGPVAFQAEVAAKAARGEALWV